MSGNEGGQENCGDGGGGGGRNKSSGGEQKNKSFSFIDGATSIHLWPGIILVPTILVFFSKNIFGGGGRWEVVVVGGGRWWWWDCVRKWVVPYTGNFFHFPLLIITIVIENFYFLKFLFLKIFNFKMYSFFHEPFPFPAHERDSFPY